MAVDERSRRILCGRLEEVLGVAEATTLIDHLPPTGWGEVATKRDLDDLAHVMKRDLDDLAQATKRDLDELAQATKRDLDGVEQRLGARIDGLEQRTDARFDQVDARFDLMEAKLVAGLRGELNRYLLSSLAVLVVLVVALVELT